MVSEQGSGRQAYRRALYEALAEGGPAVRDVSPLTVLAGLAERGSRPAAETPAATALVDALAEVAACRGLEEAIAAAEGRFATPDEFREAVYFARCLARTAPQALQLLRERQYVEEASVPPTLAELATDREAALRHVTFAALWQAPERFAALTEVVAIWRRAYAAAYAAQHAAHRAAVSGVLAAVEAAQPQAQALERLNGLARLGPPLAVAALGRLRELQRLSACTATAEALNQALQHRPVCPSCGFRLGDAAPEAEARRVRLAIERGLAGQQARLSRRVVSRILGRPAVGEEARLQRFLEVVQASDLAGLAVVLDEALVAFLREFLEERMTSRDVLREVARAFPEVTRESLDKAVEEFRHLLETELRLHGRVRLGGGEQ